MIFSQQTSIHNGFFIVSQDFTMILPQKKHIFPWGLLGLVELHTVQGRDVPIHPKNPRCTEREIYKAKVEDRVISRFML